jgi:hypothetical protein
VTTYAKNDLTVEFADPAVGEVRGTEAGGMHIGRETWHGEMDATELFRGLPGDACQAPHWGYVISGRFGVHTAHGDVFHDAGEAYYLPPGHVPFFEEPVEVVEFTPADAYRDTMEHIERAMAAMADG